MKLMLAMSVIAMGAVACGSNNEDSEETKETAKEENVVEKEAPKMLVVYYSQYGHTKTLAEEIAKKTGADIEAVEAENPYDGDFNATIARCMQEREAGAVCEINPLKANVADYDVIFVGAPVWFGVFAPPMLTYLDQVDLSGKKVVPFCTFGSGGLESSTQDLAKRQPKANILPGYGVREARMEAMPKEVDQFLKAGGFIEGEYTPLPEFPEQHAVSDEEAAIFDAAVNGYPMLNAKAKTVAIRTIPDGMEYLFTAVDQPREKKADMPPAGELKVYVTVVNGAAPVFTKVIR